MSRIGNKAVEIPDKVKVNIGTDGAVAVEGPKGKLQWTLPREIKGSVKDNRVSLVRDAETRSVKALH
ncbi:MAG TPA: 50S ribosomal protein L6, partial [Chthoniobacterales bacterium]